MTIRGSLARQLRADLRLAVLQLLAQSGEGEDRELNTRILRSALADLGHRPTADRQRTAVAWLEEQGLVTSAALSESVQRVHLTERGLDVAEGRASVPGVARPGPGNGL